MKDLRRLLCIIIFFYVLEKLSCWMLTADRRRREIPRIKEEKTASLVVQCSFFFCYFSKSKCDFQFIFVVCSLLLHNTLARPRKKKEKKKHVVLAINKHFFPVNINNILSRLSWNNETRGWKQVHSLSIQTYTDLLAQSTTIICWSSSTNKRKCNWKTSRM